MARYSGRKRKRPSSKKRWRRKFKKYILKAPAATRGFYGIGDVGAIEKKYIDAAVYEHKIGYGDGASAFIAALNLIPTGSGVSQRVGRKILMKSILLRVYIKNGDWGDASEAVSDMAGYRMVLVYDRQCNGVPPTFDDIFEFTMGTSVFITNPLNLANRDRFLVLWDKQFVLDGVVNSAGTQNINTQKFFKKYKRLNLETIFQNDASTAGINDIKTGSMFLIVFSNQRTTTDDGFSLVTMDSRIRYVDP